MHTVTSRRLRGLLIALCACAGGCAGWQPLQRYEGWTLYVQDGGRVDAGRFRAAFEPAFRAVEGALGPFTGRVAVHAWEGGVHLEGTHRGEIRQGEDDIVQDVPGIGPAKVRAFHARGGGGPFAPSGVFLGTADTGTAVHELVHARLAEEHVELPMWLEEGIAMLLGDGVLDDGRWVVDGLSYWPLRELREADLTTPEIERLLSIRVESDLTMRDNVLVHFIGWAVAFDLYREDLERLGTEPATIDWRDWLARLGSNPTLDALTRLRRTVAEGIEEAWLARLDDPRREVRLAAAKGTWKLRSRAVLDRVLDRLEVEQDDEVKVGLAINALAAAGEIRVGRTQWRRLWSTVMPALDEAALADPTEQQAVRDLSAWYRSYRGRSLRPRPEQSMEQLARLWEE
jgi:hypothetical protein